MEKNFEYFKAKETRIKLAIEKVKAKLAEYAAYGEKIHALCEKQKRCWKPEESYLVKDWNDWHDLQYRLESRLADNFFDYQEYCFDTNGFCTF